MFGIPVGSDRYFTILQDLGTIQLQVLSNFGIQLLLVNK